MVINDANLSILNVIFLAKSPYFIFRALVALEPFVSLMSQFGACSARIGGTDTHIQAQTHRLSTLTLAVHARRGLKTLSTEHDTKNKRICHNLFASCNLNITKAWHLYIYIKNMASINLHTMVSGCTLQVLNTCSVHCRLHPPPPPHFPQKVSEGHRFQPMSTTLPLRQGHSH